MTDRKQLIIDNSGDEPLSNFSPNPTFASVLTARMERRTLLKGGLGAAITGMFGMSLAGCSDSSSGDSKVSQPPAAPAPLLGFAAIATSTGDAIVVPAGYTAKTFVPWGTPLTGSYPEYRADGTNTGEEQEQQVGMNHDGMHFFPIDFKSGGSSSEEGLLVMNHEYIEPDFIHPNGPTADGSGQRPEDEVRKEVAAHGVSVIHIKKSTTGEWEVVHGSAFNRRITGETLMELRGPVRGAELVKTKFSPNGTATRGTLNNCSHGHTPWGTYLTCEENWAGYFVNNDATQPRQHQRYGIAGLRDGNPGNSRYLWERADSGADEYVRFDASTRGADATADYRNEPNTFGWIVEIDPFNPESIPQKRTALGRFGHEGIIFGPAKAGEPLVCYSGDDSRYEYIYKFVSKDVYYPGTAGGYLLNDGTLYVAKFNEDGRGEWLELTYGKNGLDETNGFTSQADVLINTRTAADLVGATKMDRPEWGAVHPKTGEVYFTLTNNSRRKESEVDAANPRASNEFGHIIRWRENDGNQAATSFDWDIFVLAGPSGTTTEVNGEVVATLDESNKLNSPDGLWFDPRGVLWIQTDTGGTAEFGNDQMLAANPETREMRRFLTGVVDCEVTGVVTTPDMKTMFVNIQHPGSKQDDGSYTSHWPDGGSARPRSATVIVTKDDGGIIGS